MMRATNTFLMANARAIVTSGGTMDQNPYSIKPPCADGRNFILRPHTGRLFIASGQSDPGHPDHAAVPGRKLSADEHIVDALSRRRGLVKVA